MKRYAGCTARMQVARRFLAAVEKCSGPDLNMGFFISCDPADVLRQAEDPPADTSKVRGVVYAYSSSSSSDGEGGVAGRRIDLATVHPARSLQGRTGR
jgi:hypothetical protein